MRPALHGLLERLLHARASLQEAVGRLIRRDQPGACAPLDRHVGDRHATLHRERPHRLAVVLHDVMGRASGGLLGDQPEDHVLRADAHPGTARERDAQRACALLGEGLRGQHVLDLARSDAEGECAERTVRRRVRVAAHDGHARLRDAELGPDHVHDALPAVAEPVVRDAELLDVAGQGVELLPCDLVLDGAREFPRGHVVVGRRNRAIGPAHAAPCKPQALECLRARNLVDEMQVDIEQVAAECMIIPDFLVCGARSHPGSLARHPRRVSRV